MQRGYIILHPAQVRESYLQLVDNLLEAIPDILYESQHQANTSTRCFKELYGIDYVYHTTTINLLFQASWS